MQWLPLHIYHTRPILTRIMERTIVKNSSIRLTTHRSTIYFLIKLLSGRPAPQPARPGLHTNLPWCSKSIHLFMSSAWTSQTRLTLFGTPVLYKNCCSSPYQTPCTTGLFTTYLVAVNTSHCTKFQSTISGLLIINARIIQGTSIGPVSHVFNSSNLVPCCPCNGFSK